MLGRTIQLILTYRLRAGVALLCAAASAVFSLLPSPIIGTAVDRVSLQLSGAPHSSFYTDLILFSGLLLASQVLRGVFTAAYAYQAEVIGQSIAKLLRERFFAATQRQDRNFYEQFHPADLASRAISDIDGVRGFVELGLLRSVMLAAMFAFASAQMLRLSAALTLVPALFVAFAFYVLWGLGKRLRPLIWEQQVKVGQLSRIVQENLSAIKLVRVLDISAVEDRKFESFNDQVLKNSSTANLRRAASSRLVQLAYLVALTILLWFGGGLVSSRQLTLGQLAAFVTYLTILAGTVNQIPVAALAAARASASAMRVFEVLDRPAHAAEPGSGTTPVVQSIRLDHVWLASGDVLDPEAALLKDVSLTLNRGEIIGVIGAPGSGKSILAQLLGGERRATDGGVFFDGREMGAIPTDELRRMTFVVRQQPFMFAESVASNIAYPKPDAALDAIQSSAMGAQVHQDILGFPQAYDTRVAERGASLSGGQRQRVSLARAFIQEEPSVLILDDPTFALDSVTEDGVCREIMRRKADRITLLISHRLSTIRCADRVIVLEAGRVVEQGTPAELIAAGGAFAELCELHVEAQTVAEELAEAS